MKQKNYLLRDVLIGSAKFCSWKMLLNCTFESKFKFLRWNSVQLGLSIKHFFDLSLTFLCKKLLQKCLQKWMMRDALCVLYRLFPSTLTSSYWISLEWLQIAYTRDVHNIELCIIFIWIAPKNIFRTFLRIA